MNDACSHKKSRTMSLSCSMRDEKKRGGFRKRHPAVEQEAHAAACRVLERSQKWKTIETAASLRTGTL